VGKAWLWVSVHLGPTAPRLLYPHNQRLEATNVHLRGLQGDRPFTWTRTTYSWNRDEPRGWMLSGIGRGNGAHTVTKLRTDRAEEGEGSRQQVWG
jgi:hypothetical protein